MVRPGPCRALGLSCGWRCGAALVLGELLTLVQLLGGLLVLSAAVIVQIDRRPAVGPDDVDLPEPAHAS